VPLTVYALRKDGFAGAISLRIKEAPSGFSLGGATIHAGQDQARLTLTTPSRGREGSFNLTLEGRAIIAGRETIHPVVPAENMMQAFAYRHLVPAKELAVEVGGARMPHGALKISSESPVKIPAGGTARVRVSGAGPAFADRFKLELSEPPEGISLGKISPTSDGVEIELAADPVKIKAGLEGNLILNLFADRAQAPGAGKKPANNRRLALDCLPAVPFETVAGSR
jgi:hypothetical protein